MKVRVKNSIAKEMIEQNKAFCGAPWIHTHTWPDGRVFPCCLANYDATVGHLHEEKDFVKIWNGEQYKQLRRDMLEGTSRPDVCSRCYVQEKHFGQSLRTKLTERYWDEVKQQVAATSEDGSAPLKLYYWDYRFNNFCNLSCRTCGPDLSSSWYNDHWSRYGTAPPYAKTKFVVFDANKEGSVHQELIGDQLDIVKEIYFAGGEPIIMPEHLDVIQRLLAVEKTDIIIRYSTNLTTLSYKGVDFTEIWPKFKEVMLFVSLDEIEERAEYWRNGTNWDRLVANMKKVVDINKQHPNFKVGYAPTISIFNVHRLDVYMQYLIDNGLINQKTMFVYNVLQGPAEFNIKFAPPALKKLALESLNKLEALVGNWQQQSADINSIRNWLSDTPDNSEEMYIKAAEELAVLDKIRKQHLKDVAPELYEIYKEYQYDFYYNNFTSR